MTAKPKLYCVEWGTHDDRTIDCYTSLDGPRKMINTMLTGYAKRATKFSKEDYDRITMTARDIRHMDIHTTPRVHAIVVDTHYQVTLHLKFFKKELT